MWLWYWWCPWTIAGVVGSGIGAGAVTLGFRLLSWSVVGRNGEKHVRDMLGIIVEQVGVMYMKGAVF